MSDTPGEREHERIHTFKKRRGRYTAQQTDALARLPERFMLEPSQLQPLSAHFDGRPVILEIGFGMGDATWRLALAQPQYGVLAVDVHTPGVGKLLAELETHGLDNVRVVEGDAVEILNDQLTAASLHGVRIFFPDPWPKKKHHKRRLVSAATLDLLADRIAPGGFVHFATDWLEYADVVRELLGQHPAFTLLPAGEAAAGADPQARPLTGYERRGLAVGRVITDLVAVRNG